MKQLILFYIVTIFCFQVQAQKERNDDKKNNWEIWQDKIPVSGGVRVGLMFEEVKNKINPLSFYVKIPPSEKDSICVEISSKDGRYSAKRTVPIKNNNGNPYHKYILPTKYKKELSSYNTDKVVILASLNEDSNCSKKVEFYLISSWEKPEPKDKDSIVVYVNSQIPIKIVVGNREPIDCLELDSPTVAYNKKCVINDIKLDSLPNMITIEQRISRMGRIQLNNYEIPIKN